VSTTLDGPFLDRPEAAPATRGDAGLWLLFAVVGFVVGQVGALVLTAVAAALAGRESQLQAIAKLAVPPEWYVLSSLAGLWVGFFGAPWLATRVRGTKSLVVDLGIRFKAVDVLGIFVGLGGQLLVALLYLPFINHLHNFNAPTKKLTGAAHGGGFALIAIFTVVGAPFFEEIFFRGLLLRGLCRMFAPGSPGRTVARVVALSAAVVLDGVLFGLAHGEWEQLAGLAVFGMILAFVSYRTGRLGMNMVAHATFNLVAIVVILSSGSGAVF
jgi:membrane protease YdiL (CAAX protease family)